MLIPFGTQYNAWPTELAGLHSRPGVCNVSWCMLPGVHNIAVHALQMQLMAAYIKMGTAGHNA